MIMCGGLSVGGGIFSQHGEWTGGDPIFQWLGAYNRSMDEEDLLSTAIVQALERGATVVTGNQRAARTLQIGRAHV